MSKRRWLALGGITALLVAQLVPVDRSAPGAGAEVTAPAPIRELLRRACYDCHSVSTRWPWYARVAPVSWWIARHVRRGRADLDFTRWPVLDFSRQQLAFDDIVTQLEKGAMPLRSYTWMHAGARLSGAERTALIDWARAERGRVGPAEGW